MYIYNQIVKSIWWWIVNFKNYLHHLVASVYNINISPMAREIISTDNSIYFRLERKMLLSGSNKRRTPSLNSVFLFERLPSNLPENCLDMIFSRNDIIQYMIFWRITCDIWTFILESFIYVDLPHIRNHRVRRRRISEPFCW